MGKRSVEGGCHCALRHDVLMASEQRSIGGSMCPSGYDEERENIQDHEFLSDAQLRVLSGHDDLTEVTYLEMTVDTTDNTLADLGQRLPNLAQLKLTGSSMATIRDLGTSLES